jgi:RND family efflux transporter MFP subunit
MNRFIRPALAGLLVSGVGIVAGVSGCQKAPPQLAKTKDPEVLVARPTVEPVTDHEDFTGHIEAENLVNLRAQVTGYLKAVHFRDGVDVEKDALLFEIDPQTYQTELERAKAFLVQAEARRDRLERDYRRIISVPDRGTVTQEEIDRIAGDLAEARAAVRVATAQRELAQENVEFTKIRAPFAGRISKRMIDPSNLVRANDTILARLVSRDPIYAAFDLDEQTLLRIRRLIRDGKVVSARSEPVSVQIGLTDEEGYSLSGVITIIDNIVDPGTGTQRVWAKVDNSRLLLSAGMFVRIRLPVGKPKPSLVIPEEALGSDQGQRYVYVLNDQDEVVYRQVTLGPQAGRLRVIEKGVQPDDRVVVSGLQRIRPGIKVVAKEAAAVKPTVAAK